MALLCRPEGASLAELIAADRLAGAFGARGAGRQPEAEGPRHPLREDRRRAALPDRGRAMTGGTELAAAVERLETLDLEALRVLWRQHGGSRLRLRSPELLRLLARLAAAGRGPWRPRSRDPAPAPPPRPGAGRGARARGRRAAAPGMAGQDGRGGGRGGRVPLGGAALPEPLGGGHRDRRHPLERPAVLRAAAAAADDQAGPALRALHPQELGGGAASRTSTASTRSAPPAPPTSRARRARAGGRSTPATTTAASRAARWSGRRSSGCSPTSPPARSMSSWSTRSTG